jgi:hypothetical protein
LNARLARREVVLRQRLRHSLLSQRQRRLGGADSIVDPAIVGKQFDQLFDWVRGAAHLGFPGSSENFLRHCGTLHDKTFIQSKTKLQASWMALREEWSPPPRAAGYLIAVTRIGVEW